MAKLVTEAKLNEEVKVVTVMVEGTYIATLSQNQKIIKNYSGVVVRLPFDFTMSDVKNAVPRAILSSKEYPEFLTMRTFEVSSKPEATKDKARRRDLMSDAQLRRIKRDREVIEREQKREIATRKANKIDGGGSIQDDTEYGDNGLPPLAISRGK